MVIVMLRRELSFGEAITLWEVKWALEATFLPDTATLGRVASGELASHAGGSTSLEGSKSGGGGNSRQTSSVLASTVASMEAAAKASVAELNGNKDRSAQRRVMKGGNAGLVKSQSSGGGGPPNFILQFVAATVRAQRGRILGECREGDDVLRLFNSVKISFWSTLAQARKQHKAYSSPLLAYIQ
jgi:hypothetical protein